MKPVAYRGGPPMVADLTDGRIPAGVTTLVSLLQHHRGGRVKLLMTTAPKRLKEASDVPTASELGYGGLEVTEWFAFFVKAGTAPAIIDAWNDQIRFVLADPLLKGELAQLGLAAQSSTPAELTARVASHLQEWKVRMKSVGLQPVM
jgi:tripartite-type tricarboxylate transporter receptor subunit TctC